MSFINRLRSVIFVCVFVRQANGQTAASNVPDSPLWPIFSELLSTQTGRTVQDINLLGLTDPTINQLWTSYSATLSSMTQTPSPTPGTTPPPLPDLYQTSYSFSSSNSNQQQPAGQSSTQPKTDSLQSYTQILSLINKLSNTASSGNTITSTSPQITSTSTQDVMNAYAQLTGNSATAGSSLPRSSAAGGGADLQSLLKQYAMASQGTPNSASSLSQLLGINDASQKSASNASPSYQVLLDQYNSIMKQGSPASSSSGGTAGYEQLLQQYNQIVGGKSSGASSNSPSGGASASLVDQYMALMSKTSSGSGSSSNNPINSQLLQMYSQMMGGQNSSPQLNTTTPAPPTPSAQETFEKQLAILFPQFKTSTGNVSTSATDAAAAAGSGSAASNTAQMIFDALLFAPTATGTPSAAPADITQLSSLNSINNLAKSGTGAQGLLNDHVQNVFKTRASREMGCRFLPELLELDVLPTTPINCMNRCPFPYVNSQKFGVYCVCCPPGVNEHTVGMMSIVRGSSYMETPLAVVS